MTLVFCFWHMLGVRVMVMMMMMMMMMVVMTKKKMMIIKKFIQHRVPSDLNLHFLFGFGMFAKL